MFGLSSLACRHKDNSDIHILETDIENIFYRDSGAMVRVFHNGISFEAPSNWFESTSKEGNYTFSFPCSVHKIKGWHPSVNGIDAHETLSEKQLEILFKDNLDKSVSPSYFKKILDNSEANLIKRTKDGIQTYFKDTPNGLVKYNDEEHKRLINKL